MARRIHLPATDQHLPDGMPTTTDEALFPNRRSSPPPLCCSFPACLPFSSLHGLVCRGVATQVFAVMEHRTSHDHSRCIPELPWASCGLASSPAFCAGKPLFVFPGSGRR